ncbi:MAG: rod shape-determining protein MreC [Pseudomonadota bacterium]
MRTALFSAGHGDGLRRSERPPTSLLFFLAFSIFMTVFSLYGANASVFEKARATLLDRFAPVFSVFSGPVRFTQNRIGDIGDYFAVMEENRQLRDENEALRIWMHQAMALEQRVAQYEEMLDPKVVRPGEYIPAQVIAENSGPFSRALILSAGDKDGVRKGSAVINGAGLIGHVVTVGRHASRVLLLTDADSHVPVYIEQVDTEGLLSGTAERRAEIRLFSGRPKGELQPGMRVVTSGTGGTLPRGLPVGEVVRISASGVATIGLYSSDQRAHMVQVVDYVFPKTIEATVEAEEPAAPAALTQDAVASAPDTVAADG